MNPQITPRTPIKIDRPGSPSAIPYGTQTAQMNSNEYAMIPGVGFLSCGLFRGGVGDGGEGDRNEPDADGWEIPEERDALDDRLDELFRDFSPPPET